LKNIVNKAFLFEVNTYNSNTPNIHKNVGYKMPIRNNILLQHEFKVVVK